MTTKAPNTLSLVDDETFVGRLTTIDRKTFRHERQLALPFPYLSGTHFSVGIKKYDDNITPPSYFVADHSRNGTFIIHGAGSRPQDPTSTDPVRLGKGQQEFRHGDRIVIMFKNDVKAIYELDSTVAGDSSNPANSPIASVPGSPVGSCAAAPIVLQQPAHPPVCEAEAVVARVPSADIIDIAGNEGIGEASKDRDGLISMYRGEAKRLEADKRSLEEALEECKTRLRAMEKDLRGESGPSPHTHSFTESLVTHSLTHSPTTVTTHLISYHCRDPLTLCFSHSRGQDQDREGGRSGCGFGASTGSNRRRSPSRSEPTEAAGRGKGRGKPRTARASG